MKGDELRERTKQCDKVESLKKEAEEITAIMAASRKTAQGNK
jgi:hypothetical protein